MGGVTMPDPGRRAGVQVALEMLASDSAVARV